MKFLVVHALWFYGYLLGHLKNVAAEAEHAERAGKDAGGRLTRAVHFLESEADRVLVVAEAPSSFRNDLDERHDEREEPWPPAAWDGYHDALTVFREEGYRVIDPTPFGADATQVLGAETLCLQGSLPAGRDLIATIARQWRAAARPSDGDRLRIVSGSPLLAHLVDDAVGIDLVRDLRELGGDAGWSYSVETSKSVAAWTEPFATRPDLVADVLALARVPGISIAMARALICGGRIGQAKVMSLSSAEAVVRQACYRGALPGLNARDMGALRAAGDNQYAGILRALAVVHARDDVPMDLSDEWADARVRAAKRRELEGSCGRPGEALTTEAPAMAVPERAVKQGADHEQSSKTDAPLPAAPRGAVTALRPGIAGVQADRPRASKPKSAVDDLRAVEATREQVTLRAGVSGPAGAGKTLVTLRLATRIAELKDVGPVFVIDTERASAKNYAYNPRTGNGYRFQHVVLKSDFSPERYLRALNLCEREGAGVIVIDSLSHAWNGINGVLEQVDKQPEAKQGRNGGASGWKVWSPAYARFIDRIFRSPAHILFTVRSRTDWAPERLADGRFEPRRMGLGPVQREGIEYEPDLFFEMTLDNTLHVTKSRAFDCPGLENGVSYARPDVDFTNVVIGWMQDGAPPVDELAVRLDEAVAESVDRETFIAARRRLQAWMMAERMPQAKIDAALATMAQRVRERVAGAAA